MDLNNIHDLAVLVSILQGVVTVLGVYIGLQIKLLKADLKLLKAELVSAKDCEEYRNAYDTEFKDLYRNLGSPVGNYKHRTRR